MAVAAAAILTAVTWDRDDDGPCATQASGFDSAQGPSLNLFDPKVTWVEVAGLERSELTEPPGRLVLVEPRPVRKRVAVILPDSVAASALFPSQTVGDGPYLLAVTGESLLASFPLAGDGSLGLAFNSTGCAEPIAENLTAAAAKTGRTTEQTLREIIDNPVGEAARAYAPMSSPRTDIPDYRALPPDKRQITFNNPAVPVALEAQLTTVTVRVALPQDWNPIGEASLCGRLEEAWVQCTSLTGRRETVPVTMYTRAGAPFSLWLTAPGPRGYLSPYGQVASLRNAPDSITLQPARGISTIDGLLQNLQRRQPTFTVKTS